ncbi:hypothetical protein AX774_g6654 [Zancudomyces culisetae]|uniref:Ankyrin repeat protein n=1 Tax=Zancudomyces culisetae TaxID=1213189 RepID=A0A1R1PFY4_ZANCU|nr:hypothetical protein AX774_g6654 [Zancudomyces culisetae]|eukprot:OMH79920.1 hypothetical protein AX774_g6654 [Zancudomyces culisetae]
MEYDCGSVNPIKLLLDNCEKLKGNLDENALKAAIKKKDHGMVHEVLNNYPDIVNISCLAEAMKSGDVTIAKLLIEAGVKLKLPEYKGIRMASGNISIDIL